MINDRAADRNNNNNNNKNAQQQQQRVHVEGKKNWSVGKTL